MPTITQTFGSNIGSSEEIKVKYTYEDFLVKNAGTINDNTAKKFTLDVGEGTFIQHVFINLKTAFTDSGGGDELRLDVGVTGGDVDGFIDALDIHADATPAQYTADTGDLLDDTTSIGYFFQADGSIEIAFTPNVATGQNYTVNELTAGEVEITVVYRQV